MIDRVHAVHKRFLAKLQSHAEKINAEIESMRRKWDEKSLRRLARQAHALLAKIERGSIK